VFEGSLFNFINLSNLFNSSFYLGIEDLISSDPGNNGEFLDM
jgi:hypothetical protein